MVLGERRVELLTSHALRCFNDGSGCSASHGMLCRKLEPFLQRQAISKAFANVGDGQVNKDSVPEMVTHPSMCRSQF